MIKKVLLIMIMALVVVLSARAGDVPDFAFPRKVSSDAMTQLDKALKSGDGNAVVDAMVRYSLAMSSISKESIDTIMPQIEQIADKEKRPDIKALLYHLEARVLNRYLEKYSALPVTIDPFPESFGLWSEEQIEDKIVELVRLSLKDEKTLLKKSLSEYSGVITPDTLGFCPSLYHFLASRGYHITKNDDVLRQLLANCEPGSDMQMIVIVDSKQSPLHREFLKTEKTLKETDILEHYYDLYKDKESSGVLIRELLGVMLRDSEPNEIFVKLGEDFVSRYPDSRYTPSIKNKINQYKEQIIVIETANDCTSHDSIEVKISSANIPKAILSLYRLKDSVETNSEDRYDINNFTLIAQQEYVPSGKREKNEFVDKISFPPQSCGRYVVIPNFTNYEGEEVKKGSKIEVQHLIVVSDLMMLGFSSQAEDGFLAEILVVDRTTGAPVKDATVSNKSWSAKSNADGYVARIIKDESEEDEDDSSSDTLYDENSFYVSKGDDKWSDELTFYGLDNDSPEIECNIYTDLGIFRPGETVNFVGIVYSCTPKRHNPINDKEVNVELLDPESEVVESLTLKTDAWGRVSGSFKMPKNRLNGTYEIKLEVEDEDASDVTGIELSEYKANTYNLSLDESRTKYNLGEDVKLGGTVTSYSGMPVEGAKVHLVMETIWEEDNKPVFSDTILITDKNGQFSLVLPADLFKTTKQVYKLETYYYGVEVINDLGEECSDIGSFDYYFEKNDIIYAFETKILLDGHLVRVPVQVEENSKEIKDIHYKIIDADTERDIKVGVVKSDNLMIDWNDIPSGLYDFEAWIDGDTIHSSSELLLYRHEDKQCYIEDTPLWIMPNTSKVNNGIGEVLIGTSVPESHIYYIASTSDLTIARGWLHYSPGMHKFTVDMSKAGGEPVNVQFCSVHDCDVLNEQVKLLSVKQPIKLDLKVESFRNKIAPGDNERWTFSLLDNDSIKQRGALLLSMVDKAIYDLRANEWTPEFFIAYKELYSFDYTSISRYYYFQDVMKWSYPLLKEYKLKMPDLNTYNRKWFNIVSSRALLTASEIDESLIKTTIEKNDSTGYTINGTVYSGEDLEPIIGAVVYEKDVPRNRAATDFDGKFSLTVPSLDSKMVVEYLGFEDFECQTSELPMLIVLYESEDVQYEQVVVAGYSNVDKRTLLSEKADVAIALEGRVAGISVEAKDKEASYEEVENSQKVTELNIVADENVDDRKIGLKKKLSAIKAREPGIKTALWKPMLVTDEDGRVAVEFTAPENNSTWVVQAIAYNQNLVSGSFHDELVTSRPLMVKPIAPRFLRHGDNVTLKAQVQNDDDKHATVDAVVELFNVSTDAVLHSSSEQLTLSPQETRNVEITWTVPDTLAIVGMRVRAATERWGDGEQIVLPVLEAASPILEAQSFLVNKGEEMSLTVPNYPNNAHVTLETCDNPMWYIIMALPTIYSDNDKVATCLAHSLYAQSVARKLVGQEEVISDAIRSWEGDTTVVSMLQKNPNLKIGDLMASPFVGAAHRETLRMRQLSNLLDSAKMESEHERLITALGKLQQGDGGWAWFNYPGCESSLYTTMEVLQLIGEINEITDRLCKYNSDTELYKMADRGVHYCDSVIAKNFTEGKSVDYLSYAYIRGLFPEVTMSKQNKAIHDRSIKAIESKWRDYPLIDRAYAAIVLFRNGNEEEARKIVQSLREFAVTDNMGMHWDNLQEGRASYYDKVTLTATVLEALAMLNSQKRDEIDKIEQWMLLMKQSNDWGSSSLAAHAVYAILFANLGYTWHNGPLGYSLREIAPNETISFAKEEYPIWGAIYAAYNAPMAEIQPFKTDDLSLTKNFMRYGKDGKLEPFTTLNVGDKVQVRITLEVRKDMDYITVSDERASCFEPVDKVSGYKWDEGVFYYNEVKDSKTNLFVASLRKGVHTVTYDVMVTNVGTFAAGIASAQCQYAPQITAHTGATIIEVR